jgi:uncharacterized protein YcsI (UPF0317 family)
MYRTNINCTPASAFSGPMVVSMRYAVLDEGLLERVGAANHERHEILAPPIGAFSTE